MPSVVHIIGDDAAAQFVDKGLFVLPCIEPSKPRVKVVEGATNSQPLKYNVQHRIGVGTVVPEVIFSLGAAVAKLASDVQDNSPLLMLG